MGTIPADDGVLGNYSIVLMTSLSLIGILTVLSFIDGQRDFGSLNTFWNRILRAIIEFSNSVR